MILAAGMGKRYGGMKQLDRLGPSGETIMDYSVYDALHAGFERVVFVVRRHFEKEFTQSVVKRLQNHIEVTLAFQEADDLPSGFDCPPSREKPWGTGHAIWSARKSIGESFAVINADDFYGRKAFETMAGFLQHIPESSEGEYAMAAYRLIDTLSEHGQVSRGICQVDNEGYLKSVSEHGGIEKTPGGPILSHTSGQTLDPGELVSMNFWGFTPDIFNHLGERFTGFLSRKQHDAEAEFYIPSVVDALVREKKARVKVLEGQARWFGVTHRADREKAVERLRQMTGMGMYPKRLFQ